MRVKKRSLYLFVVAVIAIWCYFAIQAFAETIVTDSTTDSTVVSKIDSTTTVKSPPPSAISPSISAKNAKVLYDMGMKVAAVSVMCGDERVFAAMMNAGTPCPFDGLVGLPAKEAWNNNEHLIPGHVPGKKKGWDEDDKNTAKGAGAIGGLLLSLLFFL